MMSTPVVMLIFSGRVSLETKARARAVALFQSPVPRIDGAGRTIGEVYNSKPGGAESGIPVVTSEMTGQMSAARARRESMALN
jgi:hypothetical protein